MIEYYKGAYGLNLLFRWHGSAVYKTIVPGLISVLVYLIQKQYSRDDKLDDPYAVGLLVSAISFLIIFRANSSYQRYWGACGDIHHFMSKTLDATVQTAAFHMQCSHYNSTRPPAIFDYPELHGQHLSRDENKCFDSSEESIPIRRRRKSINIVQTRKKTRKNFTRRSDPQDNIVSKESGTGGTESSFISPSSTNTRNCNASSTMHQDDTKTNINGPAFVEVRKNSNENTPSLFLQELAHLSSLYVAVAFSTLRTYEEGGQSPLDKYIPGAPWPASDPYHISKTEKEFTVFHLSLLEKISYWIGIERSQSMLTKLNAARPMLVVGGVSENEIIQLQKARGASAKTTLASYWLVEFITREHLAGSTGKVHPSIISRLHQFISDGSTHYNHARKTMFIPFPFPHAQISALFIVVIVVIVPSMMHQYANESSLGISLTFLTVSCLVGLHEVGRELENPFINSSNDIPLCTLLAMYNESLVTMCSGFHPDAYWNKALQKTPDCTISMSSTVSSEQCEHDEAKFE